MSLASFPVTPQHIACNVTTGNFAIFWEYQFLIAFHACVHSFFSFEFYFSFAPSQLLLILCVLSGSVVSDTLNHLYCSPSGSSSVGFFRQEYWSGLPFLLQGIFPTEGWNLRLLLDRWILYHWAVRCRPDINVTPLMKLLGPQSSSPYLYLHISLLRVPILLLYISLVV